MDVETVSTYDRIAARFAEQWWSTRLSTHMDRFRAAVSAGGVVFDLGCGPARDTQWLDELGFAAVGIDASMGMLEEARRRGGSSVRVARGDLISLPLAGRRAAGAWMCASLLHLTVSESRLALDEVARVLAPGGVLFISVQAGHGMGTKTSTGGNRRFTYWSVVGLAHLVTASGFDVLGVETGPPDLSTGVSWIGLHGVLRAAG